MTTLHCAEPGCRNVFSSGSDSIGVTRRQAQIGGWVTTPRPPQPGDHPMQLLHEDWCLAHRKPEPWCYLHDQAHCDGCREAE
jgi:hypothetical protein